MPAPSIPPNTFPVAVPAAPAVRSRSRTDEDAPAFSVESGQDAVRDGTAGADRPRAKATERTERNAPPPRSARDGRSDDRKTTVSGHRDTEDKPGPDLTARPDADGAAKPGRAGRHTKGRGDSDPSSIPDGTETAIRETGATAVVQPGVSAILDGSLVLPGVPAKVAAAPQSSTASSGDTGTDAVTETGQSAVPPSANAPGLTQQVLGQLLPAAPATLSAEGAPPTIGLPEAGTRAMSAIGQLQPGAAANRSPTATIGGDSLPEASDGTSSGSASPDTVSRGPAMKAAPTEEAQKGPISFAAAQLPSQGAGDAPEPELSGDGALAGVPTAPNGRPKQAEQSMPATSGAARTVSTPTSDAPLTTASQTESGATAEMRPAAAAAEGEPEIKGAHEKVARGADPLSRSAAEASSPAVPVMSDATAVSPSDPSGQNASTAAPVIGAGAPQVQVAAHVAVEAKSPTHVSTGVSIGNVPVEIGLRSLAGTNHFEIRLDPVELGRIEVRLEIDNTGTVKAHLTVDRPETLSFLQREGGQLERAFEQAGLKAADGGVALSLRGGSADGNGNWGGQSSGDGQGSGRPGTPAGRDGDATDVTEAAVANRYLWARPGALDLRV